MERRPAKAVPEFLQVTGEQFAIPHAGHGQAGDLNRLTPLQWKVAAFVAFATWRGGRTRMTNLEIGLGIGMDGDPKKITRSIMNAISGRRSHGKRMPGLKEKGIVNVFMNTNPRNSWQRELEVTAKWVAPKSIKLAETEPQESTPAPDPAATAAITSSELTTQGELPTIEQRDEVFGRLPRILTRPELAQRLISKLRGRGMVLELVDGAIKALRPNTSIDPLSTAEAAVLKWLRQEVVAELSPQATLEPAVAEAPKASPRVANQAEIRSLIGRLSLTGPDGDTACEAFADSLVHAFADKDPELSRQTYFGIARNVHEGELAQHVVIEAFEEACKPRKQNRGAAFIHEVKRLKAHHLKTADDTR
jgi:hypothetical protein